MQLRLPFSSDIYLFSCAVFKMNRCETEAGSQIQRKPVFASIKKAFMVKLKQGGSYKYK